MVRLLIAAQRYSGIAGVLVVWLGISLAMLVGNLGFVDERPISHLGTVPATKMLFSAVLLVSAALFMNFAYYVRQIFHAGNTFIGLFFVGQLGQVIAAIATIESRGHFGYVHTTAAFTLGFSFPLLIWQFTRRQTKSPYYYIYRRLLIFELITFTIGMGSFIFTTGFAPISEVLIAIGFHIWIIVLTLLSPKSRRPFTI